MKRSGFMLAACATLLFASAALAHADPITFTETTTASGRLNGTAFTGALVTLTLTGDTANITGSAPIFDLVGPASVSVAGVGSDTFTFSSSTTVNQGQGGIIGAGIGDVALNQTILFTQNAGFASYALDTAIGPLTGSGAYNITAFSTTGGSFNLSSIGAVTFTATTSTVAATPEPASLLLLATGLAGMTAAFARKKLSF